MTDDSVRMEVGLHYGWVVRCLLVCGESVAVYNPDLSTASRVDGFIDSNVSFVGSTCQLPLQREFGGRLVAYALVGGMRVTNVFNCNLLVCRLSHGRLRIFRDGFW